MRPFFKIAFAVSALAAALFFSYPLFEESFGRVIVLGSQLRMSAGAFFADSGTVTDIKNRFAEARAGGGKIKIAVVPGHDSESQGASFGKLKEVNLTLEIATELYNFLSKDKEFEVYLLRDKSGYLPEVQKYLDRGKTEISDFIQVSKSRMNMAVANGFVGLINGVPHGEALPDVAKRLYGVNKWANDNNFDVLIHIHLNDYPGRPLRGEGEYNGFAVYVPESQYSNAKVSKSLGESISKALGVYFAASNLPKESSGVVEDQELIAVGSNNTLKAGSVLIEYGYIYEPKFQNELMRPILFKELAWQTYKGIREFFGEKPLTDLGYDTTFLPVKITRDYKIGAEANPEILSVQTALLLEGFYPPSGFSKNDCPLSGKFGNCTAAALAAFDEKYGLPSSGAVGELTLQKLNQKYGR